MSPAPVVMNYARIQAELAPHGLMACGGHVFGRGDEAPAGKSGNPAAAIVLIGHAGSGFWPHFAEWRKGQEPGLTDPLDQWSKSVIGAVAEAFGLRAVFPSDKPWLPFQQWAMLAQGTRPSPLGLLIHPRYGLWQAFRGAIVLEKVPKDLPGPLGMAHPCDTCADRPCLRACPVGAFDEQGYDVASCRSHVTGPEGGTCRSGGCLARLACPVGREFAYLPEQQAFHMRAFSSG